MVEITRKIRDAVRARKCPVCGEPLKLLEVEELLRNPVDGNDYDGETEHNYDSTTDAFWVCASGDSTHGTWTTNVMREEAIKVLEGWIEEVKAATVVAAARPRC